MTRGVARIACVQCAFSFVMRLGDPNAAKKKEEERDPLQPVTLEGVTHSGATAATAGEIGLGHRPAFVPSQTRSSIKLSPELMAMIEEDEARQRVAAMIEENERNAIAVVVAPGGGLDVDEAEASADQAAAHQAASRQPAAAPPAPMPVTAPMGVPAPAPAMPAAAPMPAAATMPTAATMPAAPAAPMPATVPTPVAASTPPELPDRPAADLMPRSMRPAAPPAPRDPEEPRPKVSRGGVEGPLRSSPTWTEDDPEMAAALATPAAPPPIPPNDDSGGFEAFSPIGPAAAAPAPMAGYPVQPTDPARMAGPLPTATPAYPQQTAPIPGYQDPSIDIYGLETPREGRFVRFVGKLMLLTVFGALGFGLFVLYRNDWQVDFSNLDRMLDRALGNAPVTQATGAVTEGLEVSRPVVAKAQFIDGKKVITATGVVRNTGALSKRFIVVRAEIRRGVQVMVMAKAPAGNVFPPEELATLDKESLYSLTNPAGKNGRNAKVAPQQSVEYMVVFTEFPEDFSLDRYQVVAKVDTAELYRGP